jgi:hypothetical protein
MKWEYLALEVEPHRDTGLSSAKNMLVTTSDGRYQDTQMPTDVMKILQELGSEGWEMIKSSYAVVHPRGTGYAAIFKRRPAED